MASTVSLFCGCGGADIGLVGGFSYLGQFYKKTGLNIVHASDIDRKAVETYNLNFRKKAEVSDIKDLNFEGIIADLIVGGFPCQPFSTVNPTKNPNKRETQLFWEMAKTIEKIRPKVFIAENVPGFYRLHKGKYYKLAKEEFETLGYKIFDELLNASNYGIPQLRERIFMVGIREDIGKSFTFPQYTHGPGGIISESKVPLKKVVKSIIPKDSKYYFSKRAVEGVKKAKKNMKRALAQDLEGQCLTITSHLAKVSLNSRDPVLLVNGQQELYRRFTPEEAAGIQSFPDNFQFAGSEGDAYRQIGNAVPPVLMWHIAKALVDQIFSENTRQIYKISNFNSIIHCNDSCHKHSTA